ncbi:MAG: site-specific integrase [Rikenellaceae bacterium]
MKISAILKKSAKRYDTESSATVYLRLRDGRRIDMTAPTRLSINPNMWDEKSEEIKSKMICDEDFRKSFNDDIRKLKSYVEQEYPQHQEEPLEKSWLKTALDKYYNPKKYKTEEEIIAETLPTIHELFLEFLEKHKLSEVRKKNFRVIGRAMQRYELYVRATKRGHKKFVLYLDEVNSDTLRDMYDFFANEYIYFDEFPQIYETIPEFRQPQQRGHNTMSEIFTRIRTFCLWCYKNKRTQHRPFDDFKIADCVYGTPVYPTIEERNRVYNTNLCRHPKLEIQRDIFIFQCLIGCRVSDLIRMKKSNLINEAIEYIQRKTKEGRPLTVRVPLNTISKEIVARYADLEGEKLLPFISEQKYNISIKQIFKAARVNRMVTILNPTTSEEEKRPLCDIAASHMARRTFVGNLFKQVKDQNLVSSLSGHKEGSKAFARYRDIDEDMKRELVDLLN